MRIFLRLGWGMASAAMLACTNDAGSETEAGAAARDNACAVSDEVGCAASDTGGGDAVTGDAGSNAAADDAGSSDESTEVTDAPDATAAPGEDPTAAGCFPRAAAPFHGCDDVEPPQASIEDFEAGDYATVAAQSVWFSYDDGSAGSLELEVKDDENSSVLHAVSRGWTVWGAGLGTLLHTPRTCEDYCVVDASSFGGVRFRARGQGSVRLRLATSEQTPVAEGGSCELSGENCYDWPGADLELTSDWQTFSFPFCQLLPEGWGVSRADFELDATDLSALHFRLDNADSLELWLDDISFYGEPRRTDAEECRQPCPLDAVPSGAILVPDETHLELSDELTLHTFEQDTDSDCSSLERRYLSYIPSDRKPASDAPVLFVLHGSGANAESMQELQMRGGMDELARREGFIVVYGNAAPGTHTEPNVPNSGAWRQDFYDDGQVDDVEYLQLVLADLRSRDVIGEDNPVYLTGLSNGGGMVLEAAKRSPESFWGIAPFMPFDGWQPMSVPDLTSTPLTRVLFGYAPGDPGLPDDYTSVLERLPAEWARAMGIASEDIEVPTSTELPDVEEEGGGYTGAAEAALATRGSRVVQIDIGDPATAAVRVLRFDGAGHFWPNPVQDQEAWILDRWGFRNQDLDASVAVVEFLIRPQP